MSQYTITINDNRFLSVAMACDAGLAVTIPADILCAGVSKDGTYYKSVYSHGRATVGGIVLLPPLYAVLGRVSVSLPWQDLFCEGSFSCVPRCCYSCPRTPGVT